MCKSNSKTFKILEKDRRYSLEENGMLHGNNALSRGIHISVMKGENTYGGMRAFSS